MPHGAKYLMDTTTEGRIYNIARRCYLDKRDDRGQPYVEYGLRTMYVHNKAKKKRKWSKPRTSSLLPPIPNGTHVLVKNPWPHQWFSFPTTTGDYSNDDVVGVIRGFLPPGEVYENWRNRYKDPPRIPGTYYTRVRKYRVEPIVGSSRGRVLTYPGDQLTIVSPSDLPSILFVMRIQAMNGQL